MMTPFHNPQQLEKFTRKKRGEESEEGQKHWEILGQKKLLDKKRSTQTSETLVC